MTLLTVSKKLDKNNSTPSAVTVSGNPDNDRYCADSCGGPVSM